MQSVGRNPLLALNGSALGLRRLPETIRKWTLGRPMASELNEFTA